MPAENKRYNNKVLKITEKVSVEDQKSDVLKFFKVTETQVQRGEI